MAVSTAAAGLIGPNAILQTVHVLDAALGRDLRGSVLLQAGVALPPPDVGMLSETDCAAVHRALRHLLPAQADALLRASGQATGDYILRYRIPRAAQRVLRLLPSAFAARLLARAITRHAWTFAGSGGFSVTATRPLEFTVTGNPLIRGEQSERPLCHWHAAVFERLYARLVWPKVRVTEIACAATGAESCRFLLCPDPSVGLAPVGPSAPLARRV
ncbi:bacteriochlorophyll 4-vinyl reductase [Pseudotabrizicola algicola]|uniref:Bacteriochlorophyll 4-vinyl reductase n=1 Tax=Pseudotabrizicola algicola TaxID=2709381 RepID=A0A6B3RNN7_9RHOB|nr:bacteriochlorophyll 4-vinyl reductase [Pseudotabrizicola algicola]NEX44689.1 bacteriochlorophyll 4-vinyl reductase [Pseudotabrizicola algicola]